MKTISAPVLTLIKLNHTEVFIAVEFDTIKVTSLPFDITLSNGVTYVSGGGLLGVAPPRQTSVVDREAYRLSFADVNGALKAKFNSGVVGMKLKVLVGFINKSPSGIAGSDGVVVAPGDPFRDIRDTVTSYAGVVDTTAIFIDPKEGSITATIEGSSPMGALDMRKTFMTSKEAMRARSANDTSFDYVFVGSGTASLKWGKG